MVAGVAVDKSNEEVPDAGSDRDRGLTLGDMLLTWADGESGEGLSKAVVVRPGVLCVRT